MTVAHRIFGPSVRMEGRVVNARTVAHRIFGPSVRMEGRGVNAMTVAPHIVGPSVRMGYLGRCVGTVVDLSCAITESNATCAETAITSSVKLLHAHSTATSSQALDAYKNICKVATQTTPRP